MESNLGVFHLSLPLELFHPSNQFLWTFLLFTTNITSAIRNLQLGTTVPTSFLVSITASNLNHYKTSTESRTPLNFYWSAPRMLVPRNPLTSFFIWLNSKVKMFGGRNGNLNENQTGSWLRTGNLWMQVTGMLPQDASNSSLVKIRRLLRMCLNYNLILSQVDPQLLHSWGIIFFIGITGVFLIVLKSQVSASSH